MDLLKADLDAKNDQIKHLNEFISENVNSIKNFSNVETKLRKLESSFSKLKSE